MVTALDTYLPFATGAGSNVTEDEWRDLAEQWFPTGIVHGYANEFLTTQRAAGANMSVDVATGQARIRGHEGISTAVKNLAVTANASGNPRIDTVVIRADFVNDTIGLDVLLGTAAVNPVPPTLTQNTAMWEFPIYDVNVVSGAGSIATTDLRDRRAQIMQTAQIAYKEPARLATAAAMALSTVVGNVRTANANGAMANIDGVAPAVGNRILDKDNATGANRGIWRITDLGSASQPWRMERPDDFNSSADVRAGELITISEGTANGNQVWLLTTDDPITLGTTALTYAQVGASPLPTVGADFTLLRARAAATGGIEWGALGSGATVATSQSSTTVGWTDLATPGPAVTLTTGTEVWVLVSALMSSDHVYDTKVGVAVSGATTVAAPAGDGYLDKITPANETMQATRLVRITGLTPGSNTFTLRYWPTSTGGTGTFSLRSLVVIPV